MLVDHVASGFLVGLGLGFLGSGLLPLVKKPVESEGTQPGSTDVTMLLIGAFLIFLGIGLVYAPAALWPYGIAGFLVLLGIWFLVRGFFKIN
jgi:Na+-transporting methylmalonyl-CoA/oxaloacetate decarboxylase beta subunit